jgi:hypothetical protein
MIDTSLAQAVARFAAVTLDRPDSELDRPWAWGAYDSEGVRFAFFRCYEELRELSAKIAAERSAHGPAMSTAQRILAQYHLAYRDLGAALSGISDDQADRSPAEGEWSLRRIAAHIVGAELGFYGVVRYALDRHRSGDGRPAQIPDEASVDAILDGPLAGIRDYYETLNARGLAEFAGISPEELAQPSMYWEGYELSLRFQLHRFDSHLRQHTIQVDKTLGSLGRPPNEARRLTRMMVAALAEAEGATIGAWDVGAAPRQQVAETIAARADEIAGILASKR